MEEPVSKGFLIFAQNTDTVDYITQAYALALSIKYSQKTVTSISLVTTSNIPDNYKHAFDKIISTPWSANTTESRYATEHRWKLYHVTPYDETIVLDSDMLLVEDITAWWEYCSNYDLKFCSRIKNYKLEAVRDTFHRKTFIANKLSEPYIALHYFKKSELAHEFYKTLEFVCNNWEWCWDKFAPKEYQNVCSLDLATAVSIELLMCHDQVFDNHSPLEFIHMKPHLQLWDHPSNSWQDTVTAVLNTKGDLVVGNIKQSKLFHYIEKNFITPLMISRLEELANGSN
jgi:hypothetical protein